jgi:cell division protein FtsX
MSTILYFFVVLAWVAAPIATVWFGLVLYFAMTYDGSIQAALDKFQGYQMKFKPGYPFIYAVVAWAFIIAYYYG